MKTASPNKETARLSRVLSWLSGLANPPIKKTDTVKRAASGILKRSGNSSAQRTPVFSHAQRMGFVTIAMGTWKKTIRKEIPSQKRNGLSHPVFELNESWMPWSSNPAIHQPVKTAQINR